MLSRKIGEKILIGDDIVVVVTAVQGGTVKLGVEAPADVSIDRPEIRERKLGEAHANR